mmetsp:Transcript_595/g.1188  ORF Transcript_595/g.1188 Transcript_595/m.1188 type:complete len:94 (-) Transcript_595:351-632(-)
MASASGITGPPQPPPRMIRQDMPRPGGYPPIDVSRNVPKSVNPRNAPWILLAGACVLGVGFYRVGHFNQYRSYVMKRECVSRIDQTGGNSLKK